MRLANCHEHPNMADRSLPCFALRHEDGRRVSADEMFAVVQQRDELLAALNVELGVWKYDKEYAVSDYSRTHVDMRIEAISAAIAKAGDKS